MCSHGESEEYDFIVMLKFGVNFDTKRQSEEIGGTLELESS